MPFCRRFIPDNDSGQNSVPHHHLERSGFYTTIQRTAALMILLAAGWTVDAHARRPESDLAAPGSPLYDIAVKESVKALSKGDQPNAGAEGIPPSPGPDYYWCKNCKAYHKKPAPSAPVQPAAQSGTTPVQPSDAHPELPGPDVYWCEKCKAFHPRKQQPRAPHEDAAAPAAGSQASSDYYYCAKCKVFHRRQAVFQYPAVTNSTTGTSTNEVLRSPAQ